jgi:hypothetical protein
MATLHLLLHPSLDASCYTDVKQPLAGRLVVFQRSEDEERA